MKKVALITGANKGLGFQTAKELGQQGIKVLIGARNEERGNTAVSVLKSEGIDAEFVQLDVSDAGSIKNAVNTIAYQHGRLDILVNNAGIIHPNESWEQNSVNSLTQEVLRATFETNFWISRFNTAIGSTNQKKRTRKYCKCFKYSGIIKWSK